MYSRDLRAIPVLYRYRTLDYLFYTRLKKVPVPVDSYRAVDPLSFLADPDPAALEMRIQIQLNKMCNKLPYEELSGIEKDKNKLLKVLKKTKELLKINFPFLHFFCFFRKSFLSWILADPEPKPWIHSSYFNFLTS